MSDVPYRHGPFRLTARTRMFLALGIAMTMTLYAIFRILSGSGNLWMMAVLLPGLPAILARTFLAILRNKENAQVELIGALVCMPCLIAFFTVFS